jgi:hypothetical protein
MRENIEAANAGDSALLSPTASSPDSKGKNRMSWLKTKFSRRSSKPGKSTSTEKEAKEEKGFVGGAALTGASANNSTASLGAASRDAIASSKSKEVDATSPTSPLAATTSATLNPATETAEPAFLPLTDDAEESALKTEDSAIGRDSDINRLSVDEDEVNDEDRGKDVLEKKETKDTVEDDEFQEARDNFDEDLAPPPTFPAAKSASPAREAKFTEVIDSD